MRSLGDCRTHDSPGKQQHVIGAREMGPSASLRLVRNAPDGQTHNRFSWRKQICVVGAF